MAKKEEIENAKKLPVNPAQTPAVPVQKDDFEDSNTGEMFGGSYVRLDLAEGQVSGLLEYVKDSKIQVENDEGAEMVSVPVAKTEDNILVSLPISAVFRKHWKEANVNTGDKFKIKRYTDATKKRGKGTGSKMKIFAVKVYARAAV